jgi:hypothetical protein
VFFTEAELIRAVEQYNRKMGVKGYAGAVLSVDYLDDAPGVAIRILVSTHANATEIFTIGGEKLAAALILFCRERRVPMPAKAPKKLMLVNNTIALSLSIGEVPRPPRKTDAPEAGGAVLDHSVIAA